MKKNTENIFSIIIYCVPALSLHIESTDSMVATMVALLVKIVEIMLVTKHSNRGIPDSIRPY